MQLVLICVFAWLRDRRHALTHASCCVTPQCCTVLPAHDLARQALQITADQWSDAVGHSQALHTFGILSSSLQFGHVRITAWPAHVPEPADMLAVDLRGPHASAAADRGEMKLCLATSGAQWRHDHGAALLVAHLLRTHSPNERSESAADEALKGMTVFDGDGHFNTAFVYQAIKPYGTEPTYDANIPGLLPKLRTFQVFARPHRVSVA